jgi:alanine racemase
VLSLYVDEERWWTHLRAVAETHPGIVPVAKGNGYGFGNGRLADAAGRLGADTIAVGTYAEVDAVTGVFDGSVMVLSPWRSFESPVYAEHVVHTLGRTEDATALASAAEQPRVVLELITSMHRHGFTARELREAAGAVEGLRVEGFALHLPMGHGSHEGEVHRLMTDIVASGIDSHTVYVSHLTDTELGRLSAEYRDFDLRPRIGTDLWLGDRDAMQVCATVLDVHPVQRGDVFGYRGRTAPRNGHIVVVSGGTAQGIGLEAPTAGVTIRDRAATIARGGLDAAGFVRSPFTIAGKHRLFAEPPHMQASMLFVPDGTALPAVGAEVPVRVRYTATAFDRTVFR